MSDNFLAPDGFRYGVRFTDGSVLARWNGHTQLWRAREFVRVTAAEQNRRAGRHDVLVVVRRRGDEKSWEPVPEGVPDDL